jgi:hypothetical protein
MTAVLKEVLAADLLARDLSRDGQNRNTITMAIIQTVYQVKISRAATAGADRQPARELGVSSSRKRRNFFVPNVNPFDGFLPANSVCQAV